ncbi:MULTISPECIES: sulfurtransferase TusA family protein [unclassified Acinetobacter]|uniref:sulfurtransferase TusA family protein n=1 Tax=unclassified Acinetobacter TaxID=196816 RepID=UPI0035B81A13
MNESFFEIDARNKACPAPLLMLKKALKQQADQQFFLLKSTDQNSIQDIQQFCDVQGLQLQAIQHLTDEIHFSIQRH